MYRARQEELHREIRELEVAEVAAVEAFAR
jgi:hypothetical protein